eukprot:scaffold234_cov353-Pavlova_lutheri.AAC.9
MPGTATTCAGSVASQGRLPHVLKGCYYWSQHFQALDRQGLFLCKVLSMAGDWFAWSCVASVPCLQRLSWAVVRGKSQGLGGAGWSHPTVRKLP